MRYEVKDNNDVYIWLGETEAPNVYQPHNPDGTAWADKAQAEAWAVAYIAEIEASKTN